MEYTILPIKQASPEMLSRLAHLHHRADHGLLSDLGYPFVRRYFDAVISDARVLGFYALSEDGELIGYTVGSPDPAALTLQLTRPRIWFLLQVLKVLFTKPTAFFQLLVSSIKVQGQMKDEEDAIESIYLTVDPKFRGHGMGRIIQQALIKAAREAGYRRILGSIQTWNKASLAVTTANGFKVKDTFREGKYMRYRVELEL